MRVFLDLWGVLLDSDQMQREYGRRLAHYLHGRLGGDEGQWILAHNAAWAEYVQAVDSTDWDRSSWSATVDFLDGRFAISILERMKIPWRPPDPVAFSHELDLEVMSAIDAHFSDARIAVERLKAAGHQVYVATQATEFNARGALMGARLLEPLDGVYTGTSQDAPKTRREYWDRIPANPIASPTACVLVDDRIDYLEAAASAGFLGLLLDRDGIFEAETMPPFVKATLRNLAALPHFVEVLEVEGRQPST